MKGKRQRAAWSGQRIRALRQHLGITQEAMATDLGIRQQTISEWERGLYQPRGASATLLTMVAERSHFPYEVVPRSEEPG